MTTATHTMAGLLAHAGDARPVALMGHVGVYGHQSATWTTGAIADLTTTFPVFGDKNRPTRQPSELSP